MPRTEVVVESMNGVERLEWLTQREGIRMRQQRIVDGFQRFLVCRKFYQKAVDLHMPRSALLFRSNLFSPGVKTHLASELFFH